MEHCHALAPNGLANTVMLGSVRASRVRQSDGLVPWRAGDGALAIANFF
jgi:hypothetical protein